MTYPELEPYFSELESQLFFLTPEERWEVIMVCHHYMEELVAENLSKGYQINEAIVKALRDIDTPAQISDRRVTEELGPINFPIIVMILLIAIVGSPHLTFSNVFWQFGGAATVIRFPQLVGWWLAKNVGKSYLSNNPTGKITLWFVLLLLPILGGKMVSLAHAPDILRIPMKSNTDSRLNSNTDSHPKRTVIRVQNEHSQNQATWVLLL